MEGGDNFMLCHPGSSGPLCVDWLTSLKVLKEIVLWNHLSGWGWAIQISGSSRVPLMCRYQGNRPGVAGVCRWARWPLSSHKIWLLHWGSVLFTFHYICPPVSWQPMANYWSDSACFMSLIRGEHCRWFMLSTTLGSFLVRNWENDLHANMLWN